jgi:hypothetical protein
VEEEAEARAAETWLTIRSDGVWKVLFLGRLTAFAGRLTKQNAVQNLMAAREHLLPTAIEAAWDVYESE